jgi:hypothetical protein
MLPVIYKLDQERTLKLGFRAIARLENLLDARVDEWNLKELTLDQVALILTEALRNELPDVTPEKTMDLVDEFSDINTAIKKTFECLGETFRKNDETVTA